MGHYPALPVFVLLFFALFPFLFFCSSTDVGFRKQAACEIQGLTVFFFVFLAMFHIISALFVEDPVGP